MSSVVVTLPTGQRLTSESLLEPWHTRVKQGLAARRPFETTWIESQAAAAGQMWLRVVERGGRQLIDIRETLEHQNRSHLEADVLTQYLWTALGIIYAGDFRQQLIAYHQDAEGETLTTGLNKVFGWGWDEEWKGDSKLFDLLLTIGTFGTGAIQPRYDRTRGAFLGQVPHVGQDPFTHKTLNGDGQPVDQTYQPGRPILNKAAATAYVADRQQYGENPNLKPLREGAITWPVLTPWNLIPPPAVEDSDDFPYEIIVRPVPVPTLKDVYGDKAKDVTADTIEAMNVLGMRDLAPVSGGGPNSTASAKLEDNALLYTGYERPCAKYPQGQTVIWAGTSVLHVEQGLPIRKGPQGPRSGITYARYWKVKGRFWGRALIEPPLGSQRTRNKRLSQQDEIIDRGGPKVYEDEGSIVDPDGHMMEVISLKSGSPPPKIDPGIGPGSWFKESIEQCDIDIEKSMGLHETSLGESAPAGTPYAAMAQQAANDQIKLGPIVGELQHAIADMSIDTVELMGQWPDGKRLMILGEDDRLEAVVFERSMIPPQYMVKREKGGGLPKSQGAELQKITDLWTAAETAQVVVQDPVAWLDWYRRSLDAGEAQEFPVMSARSQQQHKAALENVVMARLGEPLPVAPFDDPQVHIAVHDEQQGQLAQAAAEGDEHAALVSEVIERHKQLHVQMAQQNAAQQAPASPGLMGGGGPPQGLPPAQGPPAPPQGPPV